MRYAAQGRSTRAQAQVGGAALGSPGVMEPFSLGKDAGGVFGSRTEGLETSGVLYSPLFLPSASVEPRRVRGVGLQPIVRLSSVVSSAGLQKGLTLLLLLLWHPNR